MEEQSVQAIVRATHWPRMMAATALGVLALFLLVATAAELKSYKLIGSGVTATNTISVDGSADVYAVPDTATFSVTVQETAKDVATAQTQATTKSNAIVDFLKSSQVDEKDIQTTDYSVNPQYDYSTAACPQYGYCPPGKQTLTGYQVSQTITVKVRDTKKAGDLLTGVGSKGASNVSGLDFTIDNPDAIQAQARDAAIAKAKAKAEVLAKSLGVSIVRVVGFSENGSGPIYYAKSAGMAMDAMAAPAPATPPELPTGQNKITSNVTVTYEIQ